MDDPDDLRGKIDVQGLVAIMSLYAEIGYREGFRAGLAWMPDAPTVTGALKAQEWRREVAEELEKAVRELLAPSSGE